MHGVLGNAAHVGSLTQRPVELICSPKEFVVDLDQSPLLLDECLGRCFEVPPIFSSLISRQNEDNPGYSGVGDSEVENSGSFALSRPTSTKKRRGMYLLYGSIR
ncbi:Uncharacterized protein Fot_05058 [Forsythia ovata]|uniref:Uncharacterized protein n=1 Tax=Forsythia ovata TaxID=205694 RepID=A0ABD1WP34_9LAMI